MYGESIDEGHRVQRISSLLEIVSHHRHRIADNDCFLILHEDEGELPSAGSGLRVAKRRPARTLPVGVICGGGPLDPCLDLTSWQPDALMSGGWHDSEDSGAEGHNGRNNPRFVQFCFSRAWFAVDLPNTTLCRFEAARLLREREGFFRNADAADYRISSPRQIELYDPICKYYGYEHVVAAARDVCFILWDLWALPSSAGMFATADSFDNAEPSIFDRLPIRWRD